MKYLLLSIPSVVLFVTTVIYYHLYKYNKRSAECAKEQNKRLEEELLRVAETNKIKAKNKEQADEKVNNLYNGDAVDNAINILRK